MARLVLGAAGAVAGFYLGGPTGALMGFELGYGLSAGLDPNKKVLGPRLADLKGPSATYGAPIPYLEGAPRLAGNIIWASDKRTIATTTTTGGKGGPGVDSTTFTYEMDVYFVVADNQCQAVRRVWSNGKLVWSHADGADDATAQASLATPSWRDLRFYDGNPAQVADPTYEAAVGVGNAPAYRGRTTIMVEGLSLGGSGQPPVLTFEVVSEAAVSDALTTATVVDVPLPTHPITGPAGAGFSGIASYAGPDFDFFIGAFSGGVGGSYYYRVTASGLDPGYTLDDGSTRIGDEGGTVAYAAYVSGISDVPGYWMAQSDQGVGSGPVIDSAGGRWPSIWKTTANAYCRHASQTLILLVGTSPFTTFPHCIGIFTASISPTPLTIAFQPRTAAYYGGEWIVAPETSDGTFRKYNAAATAQTGSMLDARGVGVGGGTMVTDTSTGELYFLDVAGTKLRLWNGSAWSDVMTSLPSTMLGENQRGITIIDGAVYSMHNVGTSARITRATPSTAVTISPPTLDQVVRRLCLRTGLLTDADIDVTDLASGVAIASGLVRAMAVSQVSTTRVTLESLMIAYLFSAVESAGILRFVKRGAAPAMTIPYKDLGAGKDDQGEPLPLRRVNDIETAARVSIKFANTLNDFQDGLEAADRLVTNSTAEQVTEVPLGFEPTDAKKLADANTLDLAVGLTQLGPVSVTQKYAALEPTDVVLLTAVDGSLFRARIVKETISGGVLTFDLVLDDATVVNSAAVTDSNYVSTTLLSDLGDTTAELIDSPIYRDADDSPGFYVGVAAPDPWNSAELDKSADNVTYGKVLDVGVRAVMGQATTTLGDFTGGTVFDEVNSVTVNVGTGTLSSSTRDTLLTSQTNAMLVGSETIQFRTATLVSPGIYTLSGLLRGLRGTEWAMPGHVASERVVLLQTTGIRRVNEQQADVGISNYWKAVTHGKSRASATTQTFTNTGVSQKPFSVANLRALNVSGDIQLTWNRRTRLSTSFLGTSGSVVPLGETSEEYHVEVVNTGTGLTIRSATVTSPSYTYTVADQSTDGITSGSAFFFRVAQVSASVGDGYPAVVGASSSVTPQAEIATVTVGGTYASGVPLFVTLAGSTTNYTSTVGDATLSGIATSLAALIDALAAYTAAAVGPLITITGAVSAPFSISAGLVGSAPISTNLIQTGAPASIGSVKKFVLNLTNTFPVVAGQTFSVRFERGFPGFGDRTITYTITTVAGQSNASILFTLASSTPVILGYAGGTVTWFGTEADTPLGETIWTATATTTMSGALFRADVLDPGSEIIAADRPQIVDFTVIGSTVGSPVVGSVYRITLGGVAFNYTVVGGNTFASVVSGLISAITGATYTASDVTTSYGSNASVRVKATANNVPFTYSGGIVPGAVSLTAVITQPAI